MAKEKPASDSTTPKKRTRKASVIAVSTNGNGTKVLETKSAPVEPVEKPAAAVKTSLEERIRQRAYELYLQRQGQHGSPEQDWLQAAAEIRSQYTA